MTTKTIITSDPPSFRENIDPIKMLKHIFSYSELIFQFTWFELVGRYKATFLGLLWSIINPLMTLAVYTLVFGYILKGRLLSTGGPIQVPYSLSLFCGIIVYNIFSGCISRAPQSIIRNRNYVKRVVFPLEILSVANLCASLIQAGISLLILIPGLIIFSPNFSPTIYMFPLVLLPLCALTLGTSWFLSSLGVFIRDVGQGINILLHLLFFLSPVVYSLSIVPSSYQSLARINLLVTILENARRTLVWGQSIEWKWWISITAVSLIIMQLGYLCFMRRKRKFPDFL